MATDYIIKDSNGKDRIYRNVENVVLTDLYGNQTVFSENKSELRMYGEFCVKVVDYNGNEIKKEMLDTGDTFVLPDPPTHDRLIFDGWSSPVTITDNTLIVEDNNITVGAMYQTQSGLTELDIELTAETGLDVTLNMNGTKNWGDGSSDSAITHTYSSVGKYLITCDGTTITSNWDNGIVGNSSSEKPNNNILIKCRIGNLQNLGSMFCFGHCYKLDSVSLPRSISSLGNYVFTNCHNLMGFVCPPSITTLGSQSFYMCGKLKNIVLSKELASISSSVFSHCYSLESISIPNNVTTLESQTFFCCYSLKQVIISRNCQNVSMTAFQDCLSLRTLIFLNGECIIQDRYSGSSPFFKVDFTKVVSVPNMVTSGAFGGVNVSQGLPSIAKICVPDALYDQWIVATNWTTYANYIYTSSEMEA